MDNAWPSPAPWIALRLDWARAHGACWMIPPEDALAAWSATPELLRPTGPREFAIALLEGLLRAAQGPKRPLEGFVAFTLDGAPASESPELAYAEIHSARLAPPGFGPQEAIELLGSSISRSFPRAVFFGPFPASADRQNTTPPKHWAARAPEAQALAEAMDLRSQIPAAARKNGAAL